MVCMPLSVHQLVQEVAKKVKLLLWRPHTPGVTVLPVKKIHHPKYDGAYNPNLDDYDPTRAPKVEVNAEEILRVQRRQILALLHRIKAATEAGDQEDEVAHYKNVLTELRSEYQALENEFSQEHTCEKENCGNKSPTASEATSSGDEVTWASSSSSSESIESSRPRSQDEWSMVD